MRAIRFHQLGQPEVLIVEDVPRPEPGPGEALIKVHVAGVNFADTLLRRGGYVTQTKLPEIPGFEAAGVVEKTGEGVDRSLIGRRVAVIGQHCYAEYVTLRADRLIPLPDQLSLEDGAAFPIQALTAYHMLHTVDRVGPGKTVLVHAAAGGVGLVTVQMARQAGARVFGTTSSEEKGSLVMQMGADEVIRYDQVDFAERALELSGGRGVDLVLDSVGKTTLSGSLKALAPFGHLVSYGAASGPPPPLNILKLYEKSLKVSAFWLMTVSRVPQIEREAIERVVEWIATGKLRLVIGLKLPLEQAAEAHRKMEARQTSGKILLTVA